MSTGYEHGDWKNTDDGASGVANLSIEPGQQLDLYVENPNGGTVIRRGGAVALASGR